MNNTTIKAVAVRIAAAFYFVAAPDCLTTSYAVRSRHNGVKLAGGFPTERAASRAAVRMAIGRMRLAKDLPGVRRENERLAGC